ncbi:unnamed protein product [Lymnaea stagnalis]|uniref:DBB domain-containing protein n=1 Tax=Lymnaea stagnalis TaxID=6523 RepID=A0AAV2I1B0_LYMST
MAEFEFRDVTILHTDQDMEWCRYLKKNFKLDSLRIDDLNITQLNYKNPPEIEVVLRESYVVVLLVTCHLLEYMETNADWFCPMLRRRDPSVTTVVSTMLNMSTDDVTTYLENNCGPDKTKDTWELIEVDVNGKNMKEAITTILGFRDKNAAKKNESKRRGSEQRSIADKKMPMEMIPSAIQGPGEQVALMFQEEVKGKVTVNFKGVREEVVTRVVNPYCVAFVVPDVVGEKIGLQVNIDGVKVRRLHLINKSVAYQLTSIELICQSYGASSKEELDKKLADNFNRSLCKDGIAAQVFDQVMEMSGVIDQNTKYPTMIHWAAAHGLSEFCSALLSCPGANVACRIDNCEGRDPADLARVNRYQELSDLLFDFTETKEMADTCELYVQCYGNNQTPLTAQSDENYETMSPGPLKPPGPIKTQSSLHTSPSDSKLLQRPTPPPLPAGVPPGVKKSTGSYVPEDDYIQPDEMCPLPSPQQFLDAKIPFRFPVGALGSRSQTELIEIQEEVKKGNFSIVEAEMLFKSWKERYETGNAVSFRDRQQGLQALRQNLNNIKMMEPLKKGKNNTKKQKEKLEADDTFTSDISEPFALRGSKRHTGAVRGSDNSVASTVSSLSRTSIDSGRDSADFRTSTSSDDVELEVGLPPELPRRRMSSNTSTAAVKDKRISMKDLYIQLNDYPDIDTAAPPPLPPRPPVKTSKTIATKAGRPEPPAASKKTPPPVAAKSKQGSFKNQFLN